MPISYDNNNNSRRCSDPNLYSLKNTPDYHQLNNKLIYLPPLLATVNKTLFEKHHQFSDTSCQERSIMIDKLIDASADIIDSIWTKKSSKVMPTSRFIREILKRSRATYSMLQLALFYIFRIKKLIFEHIQQPNCELVCCGRRMFLAALMVSSKYLNDKNYRNKTWAKIASLDVAEINATELVFLKLIDYQLYVSKPLYDKWVSLLHDHIQKKHFIHHHNTVIRQQQQQQQQQRLMEEEEEQQLSKLHDNNQQHYPQHLSPSSYYTSSSSSSSSGSESSTPLTAAEVVNTPPPLVYGTKRSRSSSFSSSTTTTTDDGMATKHLRQF